MQDPRRAVQRVGLQIGVMINKIIIRFRGTVGKRDVVFPIYDVRTEKLFLSDAKIIIKHLSAFF